MEEIKKGFEQRIQDLVATTIAGLQEENHRVNERITNTEAQFSNKITKLAKNTDYANEIQRQVLEALDSRIETLEFSGDKERDQVKQFTFRAVEMEIKIEKLLVSAEDISQRHEKVR